MELLKLESDFNVCKVSSLAHVDFTQELVFIAKTSDEISLVCEAKHTPSNITECELGWKGLKVCGVLDFGMIGVIAKISDVLARSEISIFVVSTYNTDYIFLKAENFESGIRALRDSGYVVK